MEARPNQQQILRLGWADTAPGQTTYPGQIPGGASGPAAGCGIHGGTTSGTYAGGGGTYIGTYQGQGAERLKYSAQDQLGKLLSQSGTLSLSIFIHEMMSLLTSGDRAAVEFLAKQPRPTDTIMGLLRDAIRRGRITGQAGDAITILDSSATREEMKRLGTTSLIPAERKSHMGDAATDAERLSHPWDREGGIPTAYVELVLRQVYRVVTLFQCRLLNCNTTGLLRRYLNSITTGFKPASKEGALGKFAAVVMAVRVVLGDDNCKQLTDKLEQVALALPDLLTVDQLHELLKMADKLVRNERRLEPPGITEAQMQQFRGIRHERTHVGAISLSDGGMYTYVAGIDDLAELFLMGHMWTLMNIVASRQRAVDHTLPNTLDFAVGKTARSRQSVVQEDPDRLGDDGNGPTEISVGAQALVGSLAVQLRLAGR